MLYLWFGGTRYLKVAFKNWFPRDKVLPPLGAGPESQRDQARWSLIFKLIECLLEAHDDG